MRRRRVYAEKLNEIEELTKKFRQRENLYKSKLKEAIESFEEKMKELDEIKKEEEENNEEEIKREVFNLEEFDEKFNDENEVVIVPEEPTKPVDVDIEIASEDSI